MNWNPGELISDEAKQLHDQSTPVSQYDPDNREASKQNRQQLKLQCLNAAIHSKRNDEHDDKAIVSAAKAFYAFVRT